MSKKWEEGRSGDDSRKVNFRFRRKRQEAKTKNVCRFNNRGVFFCILELRFSRDQGDFHRLHAECLTFVRKYRVQGDFRSK